MCVRVRAHGVDGVGGREVVTEREEEGDRERESARKRFEQVQTVGYLGGVVRGWGVTIFRASSGELQSTHVRTDQSSPIRQRPPPWDPPRTPGIGLRQGPRGVRFLIREIPRVGGWP